MRFVALALLLVALSGCGPQEPPSSEPAVQPTSETQCERAVRVAAEVDAMLDTVEDLDDAILLCDSFIDFLAATNQYPAALDGEGPRSFVINRCSTRPDLQLRPVCLGAPPP